MRAPGWRPAPSAATLHVVTRMRWRRAAPAGVTLAVAGVLAWIARTRRTLARAVLIRAATVVEDGVRLLQVGILRLFRRSAQPLLLNAILLGP